MIITGFKKVDLSSLLYQRGQYKPRKMYDDKVCFYCLDDKKGLCQAEFCTCRSLYFHEKCMAEYLTTSRKCPLCSLKIHAISRIIYRPAPLKFLLFLFIIAWATMIGLTLDSFIFGENKIADEYKEPYYITTCIYLLSCLQPKAPIPTRIYSKILQIPGGKSPESLQRLKM